MSLKSICVYCGSSLGTRPVYLEAAQAFGRALVEAGCSLVFGGGRVGLMGTIADAVAEVRERAHYVTTANGGNGAIREVVELILKAQDRWDDLVKSYLK